MRKKNRVRSYFIWEERVYSSRSSRIFLRTICVCLLLFYFSAHPHSFGCLCDQWAAKIAYAISSVSLSNLLKVEGWSQRSTSLIVCVRVNDTKYKSSKSNPRKPKTKKKKNGISLCRTLRTYVHRRVWRSVDVVYQL